MPLASRAENPYPIPYFNVCCFSFCSFVLLQGELAWRWASKIWRSTSLTVEIYPWQETRTTLCCFLQQFGGFCKKIKSLEIRGKIISCPILFSFFFFLRITTERCVGRICSYLEWIGESERNLP